MISQLLNLRKRKRKRISRAPGANIDVAVLDDRVLFSANPLAMVIDTAEDAPAFDVDLNEIFSIDDGEVGTSFEIQPESDLQQFKSLSITDGILRVELEGDVNGAADISVLASLGELTEELDLRFDIESVNDSPVFNGFSSATTVDGITTVDLFSAFDDVEDADSELTFAIAESTDLSAFDSVTIDQSTGTLILHHGENASGSATLTITATDTGGLTTGMGTPDGFQVYDTLRVTPVGDEPSPAELGLTKLQFWTSWYFFEKHDGQYDTTQLDVDGFTSKIEQFANTTSKLMFDIENETFVNTPEGRDHFAQVAYLAKQVQPDLDIGFYRILPERQWFNAVNWERAQADAELGLTTSYSSRLEQYQEAYESWLDRNEQYRVSAANEEFGGVPVADLVDTIYPSLYTFYYDNVKPISNYHAVDIDSVADTLSVVDVDFSTVERIKLRVTDDGHLQNGLVQLRNYYIVNRDGDSFQIAETPGGEAVDFSANYSGQLFAQAHDFTDRFELDRNVVDWVKYAEQNIAEARKYEGKDVVAYLSPSIAGIGQEYIGGDFFRMQLETTRSLADSVSLYDVSPDQPGRHLNKGWWTALADFMGTLDDEAATLQVELGAAESTSPTPQNDVFSVSEDTPLVITVDHLKANDLNAGESTIQIVDAPQHGTLSQNEFGQFNYQPHEHFHGTDSITYQLVGETQVSEMATAFINVNSVNDAPTAVADQFTTSAHLPLVITSAELVANDLDPDNDALEVQIVNGPSHGTVSVADDGQLTYSANSGFNGTDEIEYRVFDGESYSEAATIQINVFSSKIAHSDDLHTPQDTVFTITTDMLLANDVSSDEKVDVQIVKKPKHGRILWSSDGSQFTYTPNSGFTGVDEIKYRLADDESASNIATLRIHVDPTLPPLEATSDAFGVVQDEGLDISLQELLANDANTTGKLTFEIVQDAEFGTAVVTDGRLKYTPDNGFLGVDQLYYRVWNGHAWSNSAAVNLLVYPEVNAVSTEGQEVQARSEVPVTGNVLGASRSELVENLSGVDPMLNRSSSFTSSSLFSGDDDNDDDDDDEKQTDVVTVPPTTASSGITTSNWAARLANRTKAFTP